MSKCFQILGNECYAEFTDQFPTAESTKGYFQPDWIFVDAPNYVYTGWGYNPDAIGDDRFIRPTPPPGWEYDDATGIFYPHYTTPDIYALSPEDTQIKNIADNMRAGIDGI